MHRTGITRGAAVGHTAWAKRTDDAPEGAGGAGRRGGVGVGGAADLPVDRQAAGEVPGRVRRAAGRGRGRAGWGWRTWRRCSRRCTSGPAASCPMRTRTGSSPTGGCGWRPRSAAPGVVNGDLTRECAAVVGRVLDALGAPAGKDDDRSREQRYHDALAEAMRRLVAAEAAAGAGRAAGEGLGAHLPGRPAAARRRLGAAGAVDRAGPGAVGRAPRGRVRDRRDGGAWLDGDAAEAIACDAAMAPIVTGDVNVDALEDLVRLCVELDASPRRDGRGKPRPGPRSSRRSSARPSTCCPARAGWRRS